MLFKRFDPSTDVSTSTQVKASIQRSIKARLLKSNPLLNDEYLDELLPKKPPLMQFKVGSHLLLYCCTTLSDEENKVPENKPRFFQSRNGPILPCLKLVHEYPQLEFTKVIVDKGAIPFIIGGANIMCPGLTNRGGYMPPDTSDDEPGLQSGDGVVVYVEGKEYALAVGIMKLSSSEIRSKNKGIGIEVCHYLGDGLDETNDIS